MKTGAIIVNSYYSSISQEYQINRLREELIFLGFSIDVVFSRDLKLIIESGNIKTSNFNYDFAIMLDKDKYVSYSLEKLGIRLFNRARSIEIGDDKMLTHIFLSQQGISMPKTIPSLLRYNQFISDDDGFYDYLIDNLKLPMLLKQSYGSLGMQVFMAKDKDELIMLDKKVGSTPHLFQEYINKSYGKDVRIIVIGGRAVCAIMRRNKSGDYRSNISLGGFGEQFNPPEEYIKLAERAALLLNMDYCGVDILLGDEPILCEVNTNAYFMETEKVSGNNVAISYARHIYNTMYNNK